MTSNPAQGRYNRRVVVLSLIYAVLLLSAVYLFKHRLVEGAIAWIVAAVSFRGLTPQLCGEGLGSNLVDGRIWSCGHLALPWVVHATVRCSSARAVMRLRKGQRR